MRTLLLALTLGAAILHAQPLPVSTPEQGGFSQQRLERLHQSFEAATKAPPTAVPPTSTSAPPPTATSGIRPPTPTPP